MPATPPIAISYVRSPRHDLPGHVERPTRFEHFDLFQQPPVSDRLYEIQPRQYSTELLTAVHPLAYLEALRAACGRGPAYVDQGDTYVTPASYQAALSAAWGTLAVLDSILAGETKAGFALIRPPGHHATATRAMGFCLLNNLAIAARHALASGLDRVMIVDYDVHHGNGTQAIFETDPSVLYLSTHQAGIYPGSGSQSDIGREGGQGTVINLPLPAGTGDRGFEQIFERIIQPAARRFSPEIILVSAGYDAHWSDPLAGLQLSCQGYFHIASVLSSTAAAISQGRIMAVLEGGYNPRQLASCILATLHGLAGLPAPEDPFGPAPYAEPDISPLLDESARIHRL